MGVGYVLYTHIYIFLHNSILKHAHHILVLKSTSTKKMIFTLLRSIVTGGVWGFYFTGGEQNQDQFNWVCWLENTGLKSVNTLHVLKNTPVKFSSERLKVSA